MCEFRDLRGRRITSVTVHYNDQDEAETLKNVVDVRSRMGGVLIVLHPNKATTIPMSRIKRVETRYAKEPTTAHPHAS